MGLLMYDSTCAVVGGSARAGLVLALALEVAKANGEKLCWDGRCKDWSQQLGISQSEVQQAVQTLSQKGFLEFYTNSIGDGCIRVHTQKVRQASV